MKIYSSLQSTKILPDALRLGLREGAIGNGRIELHILVREQHIVLGVRNRQLDLPRNLHIAWTPAGWDIGIESVFIHARRGGGCRLVIGELCLVERRTLFGKW